MESINLKVLSIIISNLTIDVIVSVSQSDFKNYRNLRPPPIQLEEMGIRTACGINKLWDSVKWLNGCRLNSKIRRRKRGALKTAETMLQ